MAVPDQKLFAWNAHQVTQSLVVNDGPLHYRRNFVAVPNVSWGFLNGWEADLLVCSKAGFLTEVEVKVSAADWRIDAKKRKWRTDISGAVSLNTKRTKFFYYAAPIHLASRWQEFNLPAFAGVYGVHEPKDFKKYGHCELLRPAKALAEHRRLTDKEMMKLARLGSLRIWS